MAINSFFSVDQSTFAIQEGVEYLISKLENGHWSGLRTLAGKSDIWVTGFILTHILDFIGNDQVVDEIQSYLIAARKPSGGWSYNEEVPSDADSTSWCLMALEEADDFTSYERERTMAFLWSHLTEGGISTYRRDSGILEYLKIDPVFSIEGWTSAHPDVTAATLLADDPKEKDQERHRELTRLVSMQRGSGFFDAHWWRGPHYTTSLLLRTLNKYEKLLPDSQAHLLLNALKREQLSDGGFCLGSGSNLDPFTTGLALISFSHLHYLGGAHERRLTEMSLIDSQENDGSWKGNYIMRIPAPDVLDPHHVSVWIRKGLGGNSYVFDEEGLLATAVSCFALEKWRRVESGEVNDVINWPIITPIKDEENKEKHLKTVS